MTQIDRRHVLKSLAWGAALAAAPYSAGSMAPAASAPHIPQAAERTPWLFASRPHILLKKVNEEVLNLQILYKEIDENGEHFTTSSCNIDMNKYETTELLDLLNGYIDDKIAVLSGLEIKQEIEIKKATIGNKELMAHMSVLSTGPDDEDPPTLFITESLASDPYGGRDEGCYTHLDKSFTQRLISALEAKAEEFWGTTWKGSQ
jgi:hypothetical protein